MVEGGRKHILVFEHPSGMVLSIETDDVGELSQQQWFQQFFTDARTAQQDKRIDPYAAADPFAEKALQRPQPMQQQAKPSFLDIPSSGMTVEQWQRLTKDQRDAWQAKWLRQQQPTQ